MKPVDKDGFVDEEWVINFIEGEVTENPNGQAPKEEPVKVVGE